MNTDFSTSSYANCKLKLNDASSIIIRFDCNIDNCYTCDFLSLAKCFQLLPQHKSDPLGYLMLFYGKRTSAVVVMFCFQCHIFSDHYRELSNFCTLTPSTTQDDIKILTDILSPSENKETTFLQGDV